MAKNFRELYAKIPADRRAAIEERVKATLAGMALDELRQARHLTQMELARTMEIDQGAVSRLERRTDMYVSTLRNYIRAMGGELHIRADFPDGSVEIDQFQQVPDAVTNQPAR